MDGPTLFVVALLVGIFGSNMVRRWWQGNEWKREWRRRGFHTEE